MFDDDIDELDDIYGRLKRSGGMEPQRQRQDAKAWAVMEETTNDY